MARFHHGSIRHRLQNCSLAGMRLPSGIYPHNSKWRYRASRDRIPLMRVVKHYRALCDDLEKALYK